MQSTIACCSDCLTVGGFIPKRIAAIMENPTPTMDKRLAIPN